MAIVHKTFSLAFSDRDYIGPRDRRCVNGSFFMRRFELTNVVFR